MKPLVFLLLALHAMTSYAGEKKETGSRKVASESTVIGGAQVDGDYINGQKVIRIWDEEKKVLCFGIGFSGSSIQCLKM